ncbi:hypothetical protein EYW98_05925 [Escherichia coli]|nr:hypothetical protein [Escherichia coli]EGO8376269.1 hypothetical protein [Escherichia coli]
MAGRTPAINCQASNKAEGHPEGWPFCIGAKKLPDATLARLIRPTQAYPAYAGTVKEQLIPPHTPDSASPASLPTSIRPPYQKAI